MLPLTGTSQLEHMRLDLGALDFELDADDFAFIDRIG